ncbi:MAG: biotin/lipoyl-binding protein [Lachnospiraceae bacterium]|nr:biotin/lipoyl-binding protein [Lachnospiraceae bacterium]
MEGKYKNVRALSLFLAGMALMTTVSRAADHFLIPRVSVVFPEERKLEYHAEIPGQVEAEKEQAVYCRENLRTAYVPVREGDLVKKGDLLFAADPDCLNLQIQELEEEIRKLNLQIEDLELAYDQQEEQQNREYQRAEEDYNAAVTRTQSQVNQAKLELEQAGEALLAHENAKPEETGQRKEGEKTSGQTEENPAKPEDWTAQADPSAAWNQQQEEASEEWNQQQADPLEEWNQQQADPLEEWNQQQEELSRQYQEKKKAYEELSAAGEETIRTAARQLEDAGEKKTRDHSADLLKIEKQKLEDSLENYGKLRREEGKIYAEIDGQVKTLNISAGSVTGSEPIMILEDFSQPFRFEGSVEEAAGLCITEGMEGVLTADKGRTERKGVRISSAVSEEGNCRVTALLDSFCPGGGKDAVLSVSKESQWYEAAVPLSALHQGEKENYVIRIQEKETILGIGYTAEYVPVRVLERNAEYAAVEGGLSKEDKIVADTDRSIKEGERIRIVEE